MHGQASDGIAYPAMYAMLTDKSTASYDKEIADEGPEYIVVDLELAPINQYGKFWPQAVVEGCEFHVRRAFREQMGAKGILAAYNADSQLQYAIHIFKALIFAPHDQVSML